LRRKSDGPIVFWQQYGDLNNLLFQSDAFN
jgi:hypothetical protein